jgi:signal transduction histidine kinase
MNRHPPISGLFRQSRFKLALTYGGIMGLMLAGGGLLFCHVMEQFRWSAADNELSRVIMTLQAAIEPDLGSPGQLSVALRRELPGLRQPRTLLEANREGADATGSDRLLGQSQQIRAVSQSDDYIRLLDDLGRPLGTVGEAPTEVGWIPLTIVETDYSADRQIYRQVIVRPRGQEMSERYRQLTIALHRPNGQIWGYLQLGQSLLVMDQNFAHTCGMLLMGFPIAMVAIGLAAWWFSGVAIAPLQLAYRQIQQFTADAAHELRTPLAASRTTLDLLLDIATPEMQVPIGVVLRQQERLGNLVQDLLLLSRLDAQETMGIQSPQQDPGLNSDLGASNQAINLLELLEDLQEELVGLAIAQTLTLTLDAPEALWIWGDADRLCRLVSNLMDNAINHGRTTVTVRLRRRETWAIVEVQDDGPGIALEHQAHIFDRFYRIEGDRLHRRTGTGLGLAIAQAIAWAHRSRIRLVSNPIEGTTFSVALPLWRGGRQTGSSGPGRSGAGSAPGQSGAG